MLGVGLVRPQRNVQLGPCLLVADAVDLLVMILLKALDGRLHLRAEMRERLREIVLVIDRTADRGEDPRHPLDVRAFVAELELRILPLRLLAEVEVLRLAAAPGVGRVTIQPRFAADLITAGGLFQSIPICQYSSWSPGLPG